MAVAFDAVGPAGGGGATSSSSTSLTWNHTVGASGTYLLAGVTCDKNPDTGFSMTAKYNSVLMTSLGTWHTGGVTGGFLQVWGMASPPTGSALAVLINVSGGTPSGLSGGSVSFTGAGALSAVQPATGTSTTPSANFTGAVSGNIVAGFIGCGSDATPTGSFTERFSVADGFQAGAGECRGGTLASSGTETYSFTMASDTWAIALVEVQVAVAGGTGAAVLASGAGAALNPAVVTSNVNVGPNYAGTATDLGGVYGSWATPQYATGGP